MTRVVSTINLKGGTGKTTMTVALAEFLAEEDKLHVLVIDIDPQTNATVSLIDQEDWKKRNEAGLTLAQLFRDKLDGSEKFDTEKVIVRDVSNLHGGIKGLDLLPSSLDLIDIQDRMPLIPQTTMWKTNPVEVLEDAMKSTLAETTDSKYDYVLIDCPPNLGLITQNGLRISDSYLIPVIPDILSTLGIPQILERVHRFEKTWQLRITPLGIVLSKVRGVRLHRSTITNLEARVTKGDYPEIWKTRIKEAARTAEAMDFDLEPRTLKAKYGAGDYYEVYHDLKNEFLRRCPPVGPGIC